MRDEDSNWFSTWEEQLPSPEELMPLSQNLITPDLALAFDIRNPTYNHNRHPSHTNNNNFHMNSNNNHIKSSSSPQQQTTPPPHPPSNSPLPSTGNPSPQQPNSSEIADSGEFGSGTAGDEPARTLKRPRLVWTPQLHKRFVDAVAHLGIKNAVPKTIMQMMSVDGLTRENVASHLQKYRLYLKRMQGLSGGGGGGAAAALAASGDPATDHLFASSPVPPHFLHPGRSNSDHFLPFVSVPAMPHHHQQPMAVAGHPQMQQHHRQMGHFGSPPNGHFEHPFLGRQSQQFHRMGAPVHSPVPNYVEDLKTANAAGGRKVLTLFPTGDD